jgi:hypothetical protein
VTVAEREVGRPHVPWWEYVDIIPIQLLIDEQLESAFERWMARLRARSLRRVPGSFGSAGP